MKRYYIFLILIIIIIFILVFFFSMNNNKKTLSIKNVNGQSLLKGESINELTNTVTINDILYTYQNCDLFPIRKKEIGPPSLGEKSAIAILFFNDGKARILYQKNINQKLPIASITKLMTAMVVIDKYPLDKKIIMSEKAVNTYGTFGGLLVGERISIRNLLKISLIVSSNDAAEALAEFIGYNNFVDLMNKKAQQIGLSNTHFSSPHGLYAEGNFSTAEDLSLMTRYSFSYYPLIWEIIGTKETDVISEDYLGREIVHHLKNTDKLLSEKGVLGGKTGYTDEARETMILATKAPNNIKGNIVLVLLGVDDRTKKTQQLYDWVKSAYVWE